MVSVYEPTEVALEAATVSVEEPDPVTEAGAKEVEAPEGKPLTEKPTALEKPFVELMVTVYEVVPPCTTL